MPKGIKGFQKGHPNYLNNESIEKIRKSLRSRHLFPKNGFKKGHTPWNKGTKGIMKSWNKGTKGIMKAWNKGKKCPQISITKKGDKNYWYGKKMAGKRKLGWKLSDKTKIKMGKSRTGEKHPNWQGGKSFEPYSVDWTDDLKRAIRKRDKYTCQICGKEPAIIVHHKDYDKKNNDLNNLITLCSSCHPKTNFNRNYWINYFNKLLIEA